MTRTGTPQKTGMKYGIGSRHRLSKRRIAGNVLSENTARSELNVAEIASHCLLKMHRERFGMIY
jgi:hypothetical protein